MADAGVAVQSDGLLEADGDEKARDDGAFERALEQFHAICDAEQDTRAECLQDRRFVSISGAQWEGDWEQQFSNSIMVEVPKVTMGLEKIYSDYRANRVTVEFRPVSDNSVDVETAETLNGLFLADVYKSKGQQAFDGAFEEAAAGGMGAWRLCNKYVDEYDPDDDSQCIGFDWIPDADQSVFWDPDARLYDKSDAKFCFVISALSPADYRTTYNDDPASWPQDILKTYYDWYTPDVVRIAEYYRKIEETEDRLTFTHAMTGEVKKVWRSDLEPGDIKDMQVRGWRQMGRKPVKRCKVEKLTFSAGGEIADRQVIAGTEIPVVPVYWKRWFIDNKERVRGFVRPSKDQQRVYNANISKLVETSSFSPIERPIFTPQQVAGHEQAWANANIDRAPYALINPIDDPNSAQPIPTGPLGAVTPPQIAPATAALIQIAANDINELSGLNTNADEVKSNVSAEAMDIAATRVDAKSFAGMDNFRQSMQRCGEIYLSMAKAVYVEEGREVPTMDEDGQQSTATLLEPRVNNKGGLFVANDFNAVKLNVISDVTEATTTRRDKTVKALTASAEAVAAYDPQLAAAMIGVAIQNMDGEGMSDLKDWNRKRLVQQGIAKPTPQEEQELQQQAQQQAQQPDPQALLIQATAEKESALAEKAKADAELSRAKAGESAVTAQTKAQQVRNETVQTADAVARTHLKAEEQDQNKRLTLLGHAVKFFTGQAKQASGQ